MLESSVIIRVLVINESRHKVIRLNGISLFHSWVKAAVLNWYRGRCDFDPDTWTMAASLMMMKIANVH